MIRTICNIFSTYYLVPSSRLHRRNAIHVVLCVSCNLIRSALMPWNCHANNTSTHSATEVSIHSDSFRLTFTGLTHVSLHKLPPMPARPTLPASSLSMNDHISPASHSREPSTSTYSCNYVALGLHYTSSVYLQKSSILVVSSDKSTSYPDTSGSCFFLLLYLAFIISSYMVSLSSL